MSRVSALRAYQLLDRLPDAINAYGPGETHLSTDELFARLVDNRASPYSYWEPATLLEAFDPIAPCVEHGWCKTAFEDALAAVADGVR